VSQHIISDDELPKLWSLVHEPVSHGMSYGTVRDYCDGFDLVRPLVTYSSDLKDVQRFWMLKTIIATQRKGATLLEIGAGEPLVADLLGRLGYRVIVVDPYEGAGNGPTSADYFKTLYTNVQYIIDWFTPDLKGVEPSTIDCIYSISVVEHIPMPALVGVTEAMKRFAKPGALSAHAVDYVSAGNGATFHHEMLHSFTNLLGIATEEVDNVLMAASADPETYYLSAEAHNRWRGPALYETFPMRRVLSSQVVTKL
jgi:hypothetical protein